MKLKINGGNGGSVLFVGNLVTPTPTRVETNMPVPACMIARNGHPWPLLKRSSIYKMLMAAPFVAAGFTTKTIAMPSTRNADTRMGSMIPALRDIIGHFMVSLMPTLMP